MSRRPEQPEPFLRGCIFPPHADAPYPRAPAAHAEHLAGDVWAAAQVPVGVRLEFVGDAPAVQLRYTTTTANFGYRGEAAGCTFAAYRAGVKVAEQEAVLGEGVVVLELQGEPERPVTVYLPEGMRPVVHEIVPLGGQIAPAPAAPRWLAYGDAITQGWLASSPAMAWPALAARKLGLDLVNLGYAGSARGETFSAQLLADTPAEVITVAYGANYWSRLPATPGLVSEEIRAFLQLVRSGHPATPVVVVSPIVRPDAEATRNRLGATMAELRMAMEETVREIVAAGDAHLYLVEGRTVMGPGELVDGAHPGDEGHKRLAAAVAKHLSPLREELDRALAARLLGPSPGAGEPRSALTGTGLPPVPPGEGFAPRDEALLGGMLEAALAAHDDRAPSAQSAPSGPSAPPEAVERPDATVAVHAGAASFAPAAASGAGVEGPAAHAGGTAPRPTPAAGGAAGAVYQPVPTGWGAPAHGAAPAAAPGAWPQAVPGAPVSGGAGTSWVAGPAPSPGAQGGAVPASSHGASALAAHAAPSGQPGPAPSSYGAYGPPTAAGWQGEHAATPAYGEPAAAPAPPTWSQALPAPYGAGSPTVAGPPGGPPPPVPTYRPPSDPPPPPFEFPSGLDNDRRR